MVESVIQREAVPVFGALLVKPTSSCKEDTGAENLCSFLGRDIPSRIKALAEIYGKSIETKQRLVRDLGDLTSGSDSPVWQRLFAFSPPEELHLLSFNDHVHFVVP